jgi:DNA-binding transcriptional MocR family regulator
MAIGPEVLRAFSLANFRSVIDRSSGVPLYRQVADDLRRKIENGDLAPGAELRPEARLAHEYDVGREVIRDALALLRSDGLIISVRGKPSRVVGNVNQTVTLRLGEYAIVVAGTLRVTRADGSTEAFPAGTRVVGAQ